MSLDLKAVWLILLCLSVQLSLFAQEPTPPASGENVTLNGYVKDAGSGETLIGVNIYIKELDKGTATNVYGFYSLSIPPGTYNIDFSYLGYQNQTKTLELKANQSLDIELGEEAAALEEVIVVGEREDNNVTNSEMSTNKMDIQTIQKLPALLGEVDVVRSIQLLPGVTTVGEGATGFNVRGGSIDQNLMLLDEAPVYNSSHLFGFFSVYNPDAIKDVKLYKGGIPARYGGRLSSILDVRMKEGNSKRFSGSGGIGFIFSRLALEGPILKDKASFIVAARRSYIDILARPFLNDDLSGTALNFYDLTLKANYKINNKNRVYLSGYLGRDNFRFGDDAGFNWGNATTTLRWNHLFSDKLFSNFTAYYSNYDYELNFGDDLENRFDWNANIINYSLKPEFSWFLTPDNLVTFGGQGIVYVFEPGNAIGVSEGESNDISLNKRYAFEGSIFIENEQTINSRLTLHYGLRWSYFNYMGEGRAYEYEEGTPGIRREAVSFEDFDQWESIQTYNYLEPRASIKYQLNKSTSLKASYNRMAQYLHLVSNTTASTPVDVWTPSTNNIKPQLADQVALGYFKNFKNNTFVTSAEIYYKDFQNMVEYIDGADLLLNEFLEGDLLTGDGRAYGFELQIEKKKGRLTGWMSYTLARTERRVDGINNNDWYASRFDQTHNFSTTLFYDLNKRWSLSANFVLNSGTPATFPTNNFELQGYIIPNNSNSTRNNVRIPVYHRLDISATLQGKKREGKRWSGNWVFSVYNIYSRRNPFTIYFQQQDLRPANGDPIQTEAVRLSVVGNFIPSVAYNFNF
ncbi:MAG: TonB-dependent receptor [Bacteroidota bacterium]